MNFIHLIKFNLNQFQKISNFNITLIINIYLEIISKQIFFPFIYRAKK